MTCRVEVGGVDPLCDLILRLAVVFVGKPGNGEDVSSKIYFDGNGVTELGHIYVRLVGSSSLCPVRRALAATVGNRPTVTESQSVPTTAAL